MANILVVGCCSTDTVHLEFLSPKRTLNTTGGAGLYTALAAAASGARVTFLAPRPVAMTGDFERIAACLNWIGPEVETCDMPGLEIAHHGNGRATLCGATWGKSGVMTSALLPEDLRSFDVCHVAALETAEQQLEIARSIKGRTKLSAGTYAKLASTSKTDVLEVFEIADYVFMNENEAGILFGGVEFVSACKSQLTIVTQGERGLTVIAGASREFFPATSVEELDPTGAGDTICGATLAGIFGGRSIDETMQNAMRLAARQVTTSGSEALLAAAMRI